MVRATLLRLYIVLLLAVTSAGCALVEGIFKAGLWVGVILVVLVLGIIFWLVGKMRR